MALRMAVVLLVTDTVTALLEAALFKLSVTPGMTSDTWLLVPATVRAVVVSPMAMLES